MSEWINANEMKPYRHKMYWVKTESGETFAEWNGEDWIIVQPAYEYKLEDYCFEDVVGKVTHFATIDPPNQLGDSNE